MQCAVDFKRFNFLDERLGTLSQVSDTVPVEDATQCSPHINASPARLIHAVTFFALQAAFYRKSLTDESK